MEKLKDRDGNVLEAGDAVMYYHNAREVEGTDGTFIAWDTRTLCVVTSIRTCTSKVDNPVVASLQEVKLLDKISTKPLFSKEGWAFNVSKVTPEEIKDWCADVIYEAEHDVRFLNK